MALTLVKIEDGRAYLSDGNTLRLPEWLKVSIIIPSIGPVCYRLSWCPGAPPKRHGMLTAVGVSVQKVVAMVQWFKLKRREWQREQCEGAAIRAAIEGLKERFANERGSR